MKNIRYLAKALDYTLFFTLLASLGFSFTVNCIFFLTLPISFGVVEGILLSIFKTTPGKWVCGISLIEKVSLIKSIKRSLKKGLLILPLFFPPLNLFFLLFYLRESKEHFEKRWQGQAFQARKQNRFITSFFIVITCSFMVFQFLPTSYTFTKPDFKVESWVEVKDDHLKFSVFFPEEPEVSEKKIEVKEHNTTLDVTQYHHKSHVSYTLHSTKVPTTWTLLGSKYLLKALGKQIETHQGKLIESTIGKHNKHPALHYLVQNHEGGQTKGSLILVGKKVYKLEVMAENDLTKEELEISQNFIASFKHI